MAERDEAGKAPTFGLVGVDRKTLVGEPPRVRDMVGTAPQRTLGPRVDKVEDQRRMNRDGRMEAGGRLPGAIPDTRDGFTLDAGGMQRHPAAVAHHNVAPIDLTGDADLESFDRTVDITGGSPAARLFAQHMPGLQGLTQLKGDAALDDFAIKRKAKIDVGGEPGLFNGISSIPKFGQHVAKVELNEVRQHEAVVQLGAPAH